MSGVYLGPPTTLHRPEYNVTLAPPPSLSHHNSTTTLPATPYTPYPPQPPNQPQRKGGGDPKTPLEPFLGLASRLWLTTLSPALLPLVLTIAHLIQNRSSTASLADSLRRSLLSACSGLAEGAAGLLTMPRYLAMQTNEAAIVATQATILAVGVALEDCVAVIEVVVLFIVDSYRSLLLCTIELAVRGTLEVFIAGVQTISDGITSSLNSIRTNIQSDVSSANTLIQSAVDKVNSLTSKININIEIPEFSVPSLTSLENVTLSTTFQDSLIKLNQTIPTLSDLKEKMNDLIEIPFEKLKTEINQTRLEMAASFNLSLLPVPSLSQLSSSQSNNLNTQLCGDLDTSLIDDTAKSLHKLSNIEIGLMILLLFFVWAVMCYWEWRKWKALQETVELVEDEWRTTGRPDAWRVVAIVEHPVMEKYGTPILRRVAPDPRTRANLRWYLAYLAHPTCLALLFIACIGFLSIQFQLLALNAIKEHARDNANATVAASTASLSTSLNDLATRSSREYAAQYNAAIEKFENRINDELFGSWINTTAVTLNSTLVEFYDDIEDVLNKTFGNTVLYQPFSTFMYCILGSKIDNLEKGLTWVSNHAHVDLPRVPSDVLVLSESSMNEIAGPISAAAVGSSSDGGGDDDQGLVGSLISHFESALRVERTFYGILLGTWLAFALFGIPVVIWHSGGNDRYGTWRASRRKPGDDGPGPQPNTMKRWLHWVKNDEHPIYDQHFEKPRSGTPNVPRIVEPQGTDSFLDYPRSDNGRQDQQNGTIRSTFSALAAPGQAFLKLSGRKSDDGHEYLTNGDSLERYNSHADPLPSSSRQDQDRYQTSKYDEERERERDDGQETPPQFWVNKWYRAVDSAKGLFPSRGQRHGKALVRNESVRSEKSFGASQAATRGWGESIPELDEPHRGGAGGRGWALIDPLQVGRELDDPAMDVGSRYPTLSYPRRLSRAPTLQEIADRQLPQSTIHTRKPSKLRDIFADPPPPPPNPSNEVSKHDSLDYLYDSDPEPESEGENPFANGHSGRRLPLDRSHSHYQAREELVSPASSLASYLPEARVESVEKVQTGSAALAAILANMKERRAVSERRAREEY